MFKRKTQPEKYERYIRIEDGKACIYLDVADVSYRKFWGDIDKARRFIAELDSAIQDATRLEGAVASIYGK